MAWQGRLDPDRRGPSGRGQLRHGRFGLAWKSGAWQVEAWHGRRGSSWHGRPSLGMAWQAWMCGARHGRHGFCFEQCLRRKKWKLKMYVGVIVFQATESIQ